MLIFADVGPCSAREPKKRFLLSPRRVFDLHSDHDDAAGGRSTPLFNDFPFPFASLRLLREIALFPGREQILSGICRCHFRLRGDVYFFRKQP